MTIYLISFIVSATLCHIHAAEDRTGKPVIKISSGGASLSLDIYKIWRPMYLSQRSTYADIVMTYQAVGSSMGINKFNDRLYDFAGYGFDLPESSYGNDTDDLQMFPTMAIPISISYNIPDLPKTCVDYSIGNNPDCLNLTREALVGIFNGSIQKWNDPIIVAQNSALAKINVSIIIIVRSEQSTDTQVFTNALSAFNSKWKAAYGTFIEGCTGKGRPISWNSSLNARCGYTSAGVTGLILTIPYSIGYCPTSDARDTVIPEGRILNRAQQWIKPSVSAVEAAMDSLASTLGPRLTGSIVDAPVLNAYPIAGYTYFLIRKKSMTNCTVAQEILRFFNFVLTDPLAKTTVQDLFKAPITDRIFSLVDNQVFSKMECDGSKVKDLVAIAIALETGAYDTWKMPTEISLSIVFIVLITMGFSFGYFHYLRNQHVLKGTYILEIDTAELIKHSNMSFASRPNSMNSADIRHGGQNVIVRMTSGEKNVAKRLCKHLDVDTLRWDTRKLLARMKYELQHPNIVKAFGIAKWENEWQLIISWARKGRLQDLIHGGKYNLNAGIRYSIASDIAEGMTYLHKYEIPHGQLTTHSCYVDARWNCQVGEWEQSVLHRAQKADFVAFESMYKKVYESFPKERPRLNEYCRLLYSSPSELLQQDSKNLFYVNSASKAGDVHSFGVVAYEVFGDLMPFENLTIGDDPTWQPLRVVATLKTANIRPSIPDEMPAQFPLIVRLIEKCWEIEPHSRPTFIQIGKVLKSANPKGESIVDTMMLVVENYAASLEEKVMERTVELEKITLNMKNLLYNMLPSSIADKLSKGEQVEPELYDSVTVCFTDIVGFTSLAATSLPIQIVDLLNALYTAFDSVISNFDVYKVETIGDSYMCVSGLPNRNGSAHASAIGTMALDMLNIVSTIPVRHMPGTVLRVRAGVHSGSVMAGVVGVKMPRYCLFGDTVNTAARMESSSLPMRIQISEDTKAVLEVFKVYQMYRRGVREVKGKGLMTTYWLTGKQGYTKKLPDFDPNQDHELLMMLDSSQVK